MSTTLLTWVWHGTSCCLDILQWSFADNIVSREYKYEGNFIFARSMWIQNRAIFSNRRSLIFAKPYPRALKLDGATFNCHYAFFLYSLKASLIKLYKFITLLKAATASFSIIEKSQASSQKKGMVLEHVSSIAPAKVHSTNESLNESRNKQIKDNK